MDTYFKNKRALVTGAGSGIGLELTRRLVGLGAHVIAVGQNQSKLDSIKAELGDSIEIVQVNLANWNETETKLAEHCKNVDFLVNNAGYSKSAWVDQVQLEYLDKILDVNLKAPINLIRMVSKSMKERKFGSIVNVSSVAGIVALDQHLAYGSSKAALDCVTKIAAKELGPFNVRVNSVNPTVVLTDMSINYWTEPTRQALMLSKIPMNRFVEPREVVEPIINLLSDGSGMVNGIILPIDGGLTSS